jgi:hypothetical protein
MPKSVQFLYFTTQIYSHFNYKNIRKAMAPTLIMLTLAVLAKFKFGLLYIGGQEPMLHKNDAAPVTQALINVL